MAKSLRVSKGGRRYTFILRKNFRFSDGTRVTARNFVYAFKRALDPQLNSPGGPFLRDPSGTYVTSYRAKGRRFIVQLAKPDGAFLSKVTMPFFQATSKKLTLTHEVQKLGSIKQMPTAGPYAWARVVPDRLWVLKRNPFYKRGTAGHKRPQNLSGVRLEWNVGEDVGYRKTLNNEYDEGPLPAAHVQEVARMFGVNESRFRVKALAGIGFIAFNNQKGLFQGNVAMRKAVNWAIDRTDYIAPVGLYAAYPWTHLLPPSFPGSIMKKRTQPYTPGPNLAKARRLAAGHFKDGKIIVVYFNRTPSLSAQGKVVRRDLIRLGFAPENVVLEEFPTICIEDCRWDMLVSVGWLGDYSDPYDFFQLLLEKRLPTYLPSEKYRKKIKAAATLAGTKRLRAFGKLDLELMKNVAPLAVMRTYNNRYFFSKRVDPRSLIWSGVYSDWSIPALRLK